MSNTRSLVNPLLKAASRFAANSSLDTSNLSIADQYAFAAVLINPPKAKEALQRAFAKERELVQNPILQNNSYLSNKYLGYRLKSLLKPEN
jgi:uncharacterized protein (DUF1778 family)